MCLYATCTYLYTYTIINIGTLRKNKTFFSTAVLFVQFNSSLLKAIKLIKYKKKTFPFKNCRVNKLKIEKSLRKYFIFNFSYFILHLFHPHFTNENA